MGRHESGDLPRAGAPPRRRDPARLSAEILADGQVDRDGRPGHGAVVVPRHFWDTTTANAGPLPQSPESVRTAGSPTSTTLIQSIPSLRSSISHRRALANNPLNVVSVHPHVSQAPIRDR